jgi:hypothetical protein
VQQRAELRAAPRLLVDAERAGHLQRELDDVLGGVARVADRRRLRRSLALQVPVLEWRGRRRSRRL